MAMLDDVSLENRNTDALADGGISGEFMESIFDWVKNEIKDDAWKWFHENQDKKLFSLKKWFFRFTIRVKHCELLFKLLFGEVV